MADGTIPFALSLVPPNKAGLGTGFYFSGAAFASSLFGFILAPSGVITSSNGILLGAIAFLVAGVCITVSNRSVMSRSQ